MNLTNKEMKKLLSFIETRISNEKHFILADCLNKDIKARYQADIDNIEPILNKMKEQFQDEQIYINIERR